MGEICSRKWDIRATFFVGMLGGNQQEMLCGNNLFPPRIKPLFYALKTNQFIHYKSCGSAKYLPMSFPQYGLTPKHHNPIHQLLTVTSNFSLRACSHVGCWFHPASLSEGWKLVWWWLWMFSVQIWLNGVFHILIWTLVTTQARSVWQHCLSTVIIVCVYHGNQCTLLSCTNNAWGISHPCASFF